MSIAATSTTHSKSDSCESVESVFSSYPPEIKPALDRMIPFLVTNALNSSSSTRKIQVIYDESVRVAASNSSHRAIYLNPSHFKAISDEGRAVHQMAYIIFELNNLIRDEKFQDLNRRANDLSLEEYVEGWERIEYESAKATHDFLHEVVDDPLLSSSVPFYAVFFRFEIHYLFQQASGHTDYIVEAYKKLNPAADISVFKGLWNCTLSKETRRCLRYLLMFYLFIQCETNPKKKEQLQKEFAEDFSSFYKRALDDSNLKAALDTLKFFLT